MLSLLKKKPPRHCTGADFGVNAVELSLTVPSPNGGGLGWGRVKSMVSFPFGRPPPSLPPLGGGVCQQPEKLSRSSLLGFLPLDLEADHAATQQHHQIFFGFGDRRCDGQGVSASGSANRVVTVATQCQQIFARA
jgi:hypothetical protein